MIRASLPLALALFACVPDFHLEGRRFRCEPSQPASCGTGLFCSTEGFCEEPAADGGSPSDARAIADSGPADGGSSEDAGQSDGGQADSGTSPDTGNGAGDASVEVCDNERDDDGDEQVDCADPDCGPGACDRFATNVCIDDICTSDGRCTSRFNESEDLVAGWRCENGVRHELMCDDGVDNDGDSGRDCADDDCPQCMFPLNCCGTGQCLAVCP